MKTTLTSTFLLAAVCLAAPTSDLWAGDAQLIGHWKLTGDAKDSSGNNNHGRNHGVDLKAIGPDGKASGAAGFNGRNSYIEVPHSKSLQLGQGDFSMATWVHTEKKLDDAIGDIVSKFDPHSRTGINFSLQNNAGVASAQSNYRHLHFGIDAGKIDSQWTDCGRPGNNMFVFALCVYEGEMFAGTFEMGKDEAGHVYRYADGKKWIDCGSPDKCNAVQALAVFDGKLYAGVGRYMSRGSALPDSPNEIPGGTVYRYEGGTKWTDCGKLQNAETGDSYTVGGLAVYKGQLYAGVSKPPGRGLYRYEGENRWKYLGNPGHRVTNPVVYNGKLYLCSLDGGGVARYDGGMNWADVGKPAGVSQTYGFAIHRGELYASSWPRGEVFRYAS